MDKIDPIHIAFAADENYIQHLAVCMKTIVNNTNADVPIHFIVISDGLSEKSLTTLVQISQNKNNSITFPELEFDSFSRVMNHELLPHVSRATCGRLSLENILSEDKVLYLDCDLLVREDISTLWNIDISDYYAGAVIDPAMNYQQGQEDHPRNLGMPPEGFYYNTGVLLVNLKKCRQDNVMGNALKFMLKNTDRLIYPDQDGLNVAMCNNFLTIHPRWNVQSYMFNIFYNGKSRKRYPYEIIDAVKRPAIVHFTSKDKPWHYQCENPFTEEYYKYLSLTPWKDYKPTGWTFRRMIRKNRRLFKRWLKSAILGYRIKGNSVAASHPRRPSR